MQLDSEMKAAYSPAKRRDATEFIDSVVVQRGCLLGCVAGCPILDAPPSTLALRHDGSITGDF